MNLLLASIFILLFVFALVIAFLIRKQSLLRQALEENQARLEQLLDDLKALHAAAAGQVNHISRIEEHVHHLADRQEQIDYKDPTNQSYSEAIELIQRGATVDELLRRGLRREEAELLMRMHGKQSLG